MTQDTPAAASKAIKPKKFFLKRPSFWLISFAVLLLLPLVILAGVYFALKSSVVENHLWPRLQPIIAEQTGFQVELNHLRIDLLRSIDIKGIQVSQITTTANESALAGNALAATPVKCEGFNLTLAEIALDFSALDLLDKHLLVNKLALTDLQATGCLLLDLEADKVPVKEEATETLDLNALLAEVTELLDNPPLSLNLKELSLNDVKVDLRVEERKQQLHATWQGELDFFAAMDWQDNGIVAELTTQLASLAPLVVALNSAPAPAIDLTSQPNLNLNLAIELTKQHGVWQFKLAPAKLNFNLANSHFNLKQPEENLSLNLPNYQFTLDSQVNLPSLQQESLEVSIQLEQILTDLKLTQGKKSYAFNELSLLLTSHNEADKLLADLNIKFEQLATEFSFQPIDFEQRLEVELLQDLSRLKLQASSLLNQLDLAKLGLVIHNQQRQLTVQPQLTLNLPNHLANIFIEPSLKELPGDLQLNLAANTRINHSANNLLASDFAKLTGFVEQSLDLQLSQRLPTTDLKIVQPLMIKLQASSAFPELKPDLRLSLSSEAIQHPPLLQPLPFHLTLAAQVEKNFKSLATQLELNLNHQPFAKLDLQASEQPQQLNLNGLLDLALSPQLESFLADLKPLAEFGHLALGQQFQLQLQHPAADLLTLAASEINLNQLQAQLKHGLQLEQTLPAGKQLAAKAPPVHLKKPFKLQQTLNWQAKELSLEGDYNFAALEVPDVMTADDLNISLQLKAASGLLPEHLSWQLNSTTKQLTLLQEQAPPIVLDKLFPLRTQGDIRFNAASEALTIRQFSLHLNDWFKQQLSGEVELANLDKPSLQLTGNTYLAPKNHLASLLDLTTTGSLSLPWQVILNEGKQLSLQAQLEFDDFSLVQNDLSLEGLQGILAINEELRLSPENKLGFFYLLKSDAFERVDFNQIEPYLAGKKSFTFKKLTLGELEVGPLQAMFNIRQNLIELPQLNLQLFAGNLAGNFYLDITPNAWRLGLLSRISQLDLRLLLPKKATSDYAPISLRTALEFDFNQRLLEGRMDISDITRSQLLQLLELVDPEYLDAQINTVRSALRLAHPQWISAVMQNGLMDLTFSLSLFDKPLRAHGLPLSPIIERFGEEALLLPDQLPLE